MFFWSGLTTPEPSIPLDPLGIRDRNIHLGAPHMNALTISMIVWGFVAAAFVALMIYRGVLGHRATHQLFLSEAVLPTHIESEEVHRKVNFIAPLCRGVGVATGLMTLLVIGMWVSHILMADTHVI
jgi:hypothetical protein